MARHLLAPAYTGCFPGSSELGDLSNLQVLELYNNSLSGTFPSELGDLSNLQELELYNNSLSGTFPSELGELSSLQVILLDKSLSSTIGSDDHNLGEKGNGGNNKLSAPWLLDIDALLYGRDGDDTLYGRDGDDTLYGRDGDDILYGYQGEDILYGGSGDDILEEGHGNNSLYGNEGADTFVLGKYRQGKHTIYDFEDGTDKIKLSGLSFEKVEIVKMGSSTSIKVEGDDIEFAILRGIDPGLIDKTDFISPDLVG
ncbi:MAG: hypothetical protein GDA48_27240 [Hormoscilla sp. GM102CHS1]|nr:hypothetical protein [Hormoscilla sp. GM102CHS1]